MGAYCVNSKSERPVGMEVPSRGLLAACKGESNGSNSVNIINKTNKNAVINKKRR